MARGIEPFTVVSRGGIYYYRLQGWPSGRYKSLSIRDDGKKATEREAYRIAGEAFKESEELHTGSITLEKFCSQFWGSRCPYLSSVKKRPTERTIGAYRMYTEKVKSLALAKMQLSDMKKIDAMKARTEIIQRWGNTRTSHFILLIFKMIIKTAYRLEIIGRDLTAGLSGIEVEKKDRDALTREELKRLFNPDNFTNRVWFLVFSFAYLTGMRKSEIFALTWGQVREDRIIIDRAWKDAHNTIIGPPKSGKARQIIMSDAVKSIFSEMSNISNGCELVFTLDGKTLPQWGYHWEKALEKSGITRKNITPHSLRHTLASDLASIGVPTDIIREALGWGSDIIRLNYTHITAERQSGILDKAINKLII